MNGVNLICFGACTPLGTSWSETRTGLLEGEVAPKPESVHGRKTCLSRVNDPLPGSNRLPRYHRLALRAVEDLRDQVRFPENVPLGLVVSTSKGALGLNDPRTVTGPHNPGNCASAVGQRLKDCSISRISSPNTACATGLTALIQGARWIEDGEVQHALVISSESCFEPLLLAGYANLGVLCDEQGMRPFHPERTGFALAEAAGAVYLAKSSFACDNGLESLARLPGWGETCDAYHMTRMKAEGTQITRAIDRSLRQSGVKKRNVDLLHAHLTTTQANDRIERKLYSRWPKPVLLQGIKPALGHTIGAAGLLEVMATVEALNRERPFPLALDSNGKIPRPGQSIDEEVKTELNWEWGVSWNMGFGGHNAAVSINAR